MHSNRPPWGGGQHKGLCCSAPGCNLVLMLAVSIPQRGMRWEERKRESETLLRYNNGGQLRNLFIKLIK